MTDAELAALLAELRGLKSVIARFADAVVRLSTSSDQQREAVGQLVDAVSELSRHLQRLEVKGGQQ